MPAPALAPWLFLVLAAVGLAGCGWAEWPPRQWQAPPGGGGPVASLPPQAPTGAAPGKSDPLFVGATAVRVGRGDTVYGLSRRHRVSARAIIDANDLSPPYHLRVGQRIVLPRDRGHTVRRGDTLSGISRTYGVDTYVLARANALKPPYTIYVGQTLRIPWKGRAQASAGAKPEAAAAPKPAAVATGRVTRPKPVPRPPAASGGFAWPVQGRVIAGFGKTGKGRHNDGINIAAARGTPVVAAENGVVAYAGNELRGFGNLLLVKHDGGWITAYAHNEALLVRRGDRVRKGQKIARVGSSGGVTTPQLHFELRKGKNAVDPRKFLGKSSA